MFNETNMDANINNARQNIEGYETNFRNDRNSYGGDLMIYIAN